MSDRPSEWIEPPGPQTRLPAQLPDDPYKVVLQGDPIVPLGTDLPIDLGSVGAQLGRGFLDWRQQNVDALERGLRDAPSTLAELRGTSLDVGNPALMAFASPGSIRGFHGTPHLFPAEEGAPFGRFRDEAIGSGEGAQAYGYGHYVAGNPKVAQEYIPKDGGLSQLQLNGKPPSPQDLAELTLKALDYGPVGIEALHDIHLTAPMYDSIDQFKNIIGDTILPAKHPDIPLYNARFGILDHMQEKGYDIGRTPEGGNLLEVHILPEESDLLDWDKPLSQQSEGVRQRIDPSHKAYAVGHTGVADPTGGEFYRALSRLKIGDLPLMDMADFNPAGASQALHEAGIPGLRYLDAGSRQAPDIADLEQSLARIQALPEGQQSPTLLKMAQQRLEDARNWTPTSNYVIFHPSNLRITARNGQRLEPVDHDPFAEEP